jgi:hypothetical protein
MDEVFGLEIGPFLRALPAFEDEFDKHRQTEILVLHSFIHVSSGVAPGTQAQLVKGKLPVVAANQGIHPAEGRAAVAHQPRDIGHSL